MSTTPGHISKGNQEASSPENRSGYDRRCFEDRRRFNYTPPGGVERRKPGDRRSWIDRREEVRRQFE